MELSPLALQVGFVASGPPGRSLWFDCLVSFSFFFFFGKTTVFFQQKAHNVGFLPCCDVSHRRESFVLVLEDKGKFMEDMRSRRKGIPGPSRNDKSMIRLGLSPLEQRVRPRQGGELSREA